MMNEPRGYWSSVFHEATVLMKDKPHLGGENAFWMARNKVDQNFSNPGGMEKPLGYLSPRYGMGENLVLLP
jgi:hypothetical protein